MSGLLHELDQAAAQLHGLICKGLTTALSSDDLSRITDLIDSNKGILHRKDLTRSTPLANAIRSGNKLLVQVYNQFFVLHLVDRLVDVSYVCLYV